MLGCFYFGVVTVRLCAGYLVGLARAFHRFRSDRHEPFRGVGEAAKYGPRDVSAELRHFSVPDAIGVCLEASPARSKGKN